MYQSNQHIDLENDKKISLFVVFYFIASAANATMKVTLPISGVMSGRLSLIWGGLILFFMFRAFLPVYHRSSKILIGSYSIFVFAYLVSIAMCIDRAEPISVILKSSAFLTLVWWIPIGVYSCSVKDKAILYRYFVTASYIISTILFLNLLFHVSDEVDGSVEYDMFFGFALITPTLIHINEFFRKKKKGVLFLAILEILALILYANRAVLVPIAFFLFYHYMFDGGKNGVITAFCFLIASLLILIFRDSFISLLVSLFSRLGLQSRTLTLMIEGRISDSAGRGDFWRYCLQMVQDKPLFGWGLGGELYTLGKNFSGPYNDLSLASAHNGVLQLVVELGLLVGSIVTFIMIHPILHLKKVKDVFTHDLILVFFSSYGVTRLISADGFLTAPQVAIYIYLFYHYKQGVKE